MSATAELIRSEIEQAAEPPKCTDGYDLVGLFMSLRDRQESAKTDYEEAKKSLDSISRELASATSALKAAFAASGLEAIEWKSGWRSQIITFDGANLRVLAPSSVMTLRLPQEPT